MYYRLKIWHLDLTHKIKTRWSAGWSAPSPGWSPTIQRMVTSHQPCKGWSPTIPNLKVTNSVNFNKYLSSLTQCCNNFQWIIVHGTFVLGYSSPRKLLTSLVGWDLSRCVQIKKPRIYHVKSKPKRHNKIFIIILEAPYSKFPKQCKYCCQYLLTGYNTSWGWAVPSSGQASTSLALIVSLFSLFSETSVGGWEGFGRFGLVGLVWKFLFDRFGKFVLVGSVWFGRFGLVGLVC